MNRSSIPDTDKRIFLQSVKNCCGASQPPIECVTERLSSEGQRRGVKLTTQPNAKVQNKWHFSCIPHMTVF